MQWKCGLSDNLVRKHSFDALREAVQVTLGEAGMWMHSRPILHAGSFWVCRRSAKVSDTEPDWVESPVSISEVLKHKQGGMTYMQSGNKEGGIWSFRTSGVSEELEEPEVRTNSI